MKILGIIFLVLSVLLGAASGVAKVMLMPQELEFFGAAGMTALGIRLFGAAQILGAILLVLPHTRLIGCAVLGLTYLASAVLVFMTGNMGFGVFSLLPVLLLAFIAYQSRVTSKP